ncbi:uncharacterized protein [Nicotiana tomentosiformis]|uniref:uncharacterized protein n=1 Tax=Nicotiana tomentosiformis TaxID=4098 RepID=UPI00388C6A99
MTGPPSGPFIDTVMIDNDEEVVDEGASLHRRRRSSSSQQDAQHVEIVAPTEDDVSTLWGEFDLANFLASEGLQRLIHEKEELTSERDQLLAERDQTVLRLSELETKAAKAVVLEARLQKSEQEVVTLRYEIGPLRVRFDEAKAKWAEVQNVILAATDREAASAKRVINLEATLNSKSEELAVVEAKHAQLEEKYRKTFEHNMFFSSTVRELDFSLQSTRSAREKLSAEVTQLKQEFMHRVTSLIVENTYSMYSMRIKTMEEAKDGIIDVDVEIAKARELELAVKNGIQVQSDALGSSDSGSEFSKTEEGSEGDEAEGQTGENAELSAEPTTLSGNADTSLPPGPGGAAV